MHELEAPVFQPSLASSPPPSPFPPFPPGVFGVLWLHTLDPLHTVWFVDLEIAYGCHKSILRLPLQSSRPLSTLKAADNDTPLHGDLQEHQIE